MSEKLGSAVLELKTTLDKYKGEMKIARQQAESLSRRFDKFGRKLAKVGKNLTMFVTLPLAALGGLALKNAADFEKQRVAFETLLGSVDKAQVLLQQLEDFSATTPFQLPGLIEGTKRLLAFGIASEDIIKTMNNLGNAAMGDQAKLDSLTDAFGKVKARGKASMRELNMFLYAGVPIVDALAKGFEVTTEELFKMSEQGKVTFDDVNRALEDLTTGTGMFAGMIEKQSQTLSGLFSTLKDNITLLLKDMGDAFLPAIKRIIESITEWVQWFRGLSDSTKKLIGIIGIIVAAIGPFLLIAGKLAIAVGALIPIFATAKAAFLALSAAMAVNPILLIIGAVAALGMGIALLINKTRAGIKSQDSFTRSMEDQKEKIEETTEAMKRFGKAYEDLTLRQKIARIETKIINQELKIQEATAKKNKNAVLILNLALDNFKKTLKELNDQLTKETNKAFGETADILKTKVSKELKNAERLGRIFGKTAEEVAEDKISILQSAIEELLEAGDPGGMGSVLQGFINQYRELGGEVEEYAKAIEAAAERQRKAAESIENIKAGFKAEREARQESLQQRLDDYLAAKDEFQLVRLDDEGREIESLRRQADAFVAAGINRIEIEEWVQKEIDKVEEKYAKVKIERQIEDAQNIIAITQDLFSRLSGIVSQFATFEQTTFDNEYERRRQQIEDTVENERDKETALAELDDEFDARRKGMQRDQAKRSKLIALFESIINTAAAVTDVIANPILAGIVAGLGAAQTALIAATPIPTFATGADFVVPPGYPNDSYLMAAQSGERVTVTPRGGKSRSVIFDIHDFVLAGSNIREFAKILRQEFDSIEVLGQ